MDCFTGWKTGHKTEKELESVEIRKYIYQSHIGQDHRKALKEIKAMYIDSNG